MIPKSITCEHILKAIAEIDRNGVSAGRQSTRFHLFFNGKQYPPKYVISLAHGFAEGHELDPSIFGGGQESNAFLAHLGFQVGRSLQSDQVAIPTRPTRTEASPKVPQESRTTKGVQP